MHPPTPTECHALQITERYPIADYVDAPLYLKVSEQLSSMYQRDREDRSLFSRNGVSLRSVDFFLVAGNKAGGEYVRRGEGQG